MRARLVLLICALLTASSAAFVLAIPAAAATPASGRYTAVTPTRLLDTRTSTGGHHARVGAKGSVSVAVTGTHGKATIPSTAAAVVLNVTVTSATAGGYITVYAGTRRPTVSNLNFVKGQTVPNLVVAPVAGGRVSLYNGSGGTVQLIADVAGYFTGGKPTSTQLGAFGAVTPTRLLDTRTTTGGHKGAVKAKASVQFAVTGTHGSAAVPAGVSAVVLNVTATGSTSSGYVTAYGGSRPGSSNLNYVKGRTVPNLVVVPVGAGGKVNLYNGSSGSVELIADVQGYFLAGDPTSAGALGALAPVRLLDTRNGTGTGKAAVKPGKIVTLATGGRGGVPLTGTSAVVLNVTVTQPASSGYLTVYSGTSGSPRPGVSNLNFAKGRTVANLVVVKPDPAGKVSFYNGSGGTVQIIADVFGYVRATNAPVPAVTSISRYVRSVSSAPGGFADPATTGEGCSDAKVGSTFALLDIGAQLNKKTGVQLTAVDTSVSYADLVNAIDDYLTSFAACTTKVATVAIGTNNDASDWTSYTATERGTDWANKVVDAVMAPSGVTIVGADDIEGSFFSTEAQAQHWETAYLKATTAALIFNGSADGCPTTYGGTGKTCSYGWTEKQYYALAHNGSRIKPLPQVYYPAQAVQWANIDATGGKGLVFAGSLTEHGAACGADCAMTADEGWAALSHALSTVIATPVLPVASDLRISS